MFCETARIDLKKAMVDVTPLWQFLALLTVHWIADFVLQTSWQAGNKHRRLGALAGHVAVYTIAIGISASVLFPFRFDHWTLFTALNGALHFATDFVTSRVSSALRDKDQHLFFITMGFDQLVHQVTLAGIMWLVYYR